MCETSIEQGKINIPSQEFFKKIHEYNPNLTLDYELTELAHELTHHIKNRKVHSFAEADEWIKKKAPTFNNFKKIITVYNPKITTFSPDLYFFSKTDFTEINKDKSLNRIGISVLPLKSKKIIFAVLFAEFEEDDITTKFRSIIKQYSNKIPNLQAFSIEPFYELINSFRSIFQLPEVKIDDSIFESGASDQEGEFKELNIFVDKDQDILLSCLLDPSFIQLIFSPIESIFVRPEDYDQKSTAIHIKGKFVKNIQNSQINAQINDETISKERDQIERESFSQVEIIEDNKSHITSELEQQTPTEEDSRFAEEKDIDTNMQKETKGTDSKIDEPVTKDQENHISAEKLPETEVQKSLTEEKANEEQATVISSNEEEISSTTRQPTTIQEEPTIEEEEYQDQIQSTSPSKPEETSLLPEEPIIEEEEDQENIKPTATKDEKETAQQNSEEQFIEEEEEEKDTKEQPEQEPQAAIPEDTQIMIGEKEELPSVEEVKATPIHSTSIQEEPQEIEEEEEDKEQAPIENPVSTLEHLLVPEDNVVTEEEEDQEKEEEEQASNKIQKDDQVIAAEQPSAVEQISSENQETDSQLNTSYESTDQSKEYRHIVINKTPNSKPIQQYDYEDTPSMQPKSILTPTSAKRTSLNQQFNDEDDLINTKGNTKINYRDEFTNNIEDANNINATDDTDNIDTNNINISENMNPSQETNNANNAINNIADEISEINKEIKEANNEINNTNEKIDSINKEISITASEISETNKEIDNTSNEINTTANETNAISKEIDNANNEAPKTNKDNDNDNNNGFDGDDTLDSIPKPIDLDAPCINPEDCVKRSLLVYNNTYNITSTEKPIKEMSEKLLHFMEDHKDDFSQSITEKTIRSFFDHDITEYKKGLVIYNMTWKDIQTRLETTPKGYRYNPQQTKENVIFAIASTIQDDSNQADPKFNLAYVTRSQNIDSQFIRSNHSQSIFLTPNPKAQTSTLEDQTPIKPYTSQIFENTSKTPNRNQNSNTTSIPSRYSEESQKIEFEIGAFLRSMKKSGSLPINTELSDRLRKTLLENRGKEWVHTEFKTMFEDEIDHSWARLYLNMGYAEILKKVKHEYKTMFARKIISATTFIIAAICESESTNTFTAVVVSGSLKTNESKNNDNNNNNNNEQNQANTSTKQSTQLTNLNLGDSKGSATNSSASLSLSGNSSGSATPRGSARRRNPRREIGDFERSRLFLEQFNTYRESIGKGPLEFNVKLIDPAKHLSKTIMQNFTLVNPQPFIQEAYQIPGVENVMVCSAFSSKSNDYVKRCFNQMLLRSKDAIESENDKIAVAYWNDESKNVSVACFLFRLKKQ